MNSVKDDPDHLQQKGVYKIKCSCGDCYIGETGRTFKIRFKEHGADIRLGRIKTSALVEHSNKTFHHICLEEAVIIAKENHHFKRKIREALEIFKHPHNLNRDGDLDISRNWVHVLSG